MSTFHAYPETLHTPGQLAETEWFRLTDPAAAVAATLKHDPDAVVLRCADLQAMAPGGMAA